MKNLSNAWFFLPFTRAGRYSQWSAMNFQEVILKHFMVDDCAQNAHNAANLAFSADKRADAMAMAVAAGHFKNYLLGVERAAEQAADRAEELDDAIVQARNGEAV